jgi:hypothetical protein
MSARKSSNLKLSLIACAGFLPMLALGACADYVGRSDTITASAGDAVAHNKVVHIDDPWPRVALDTRITRSGQRVDKVTKTYINGPAAASPTSLSIQLPTSNSPSPDGSPPAQ